MCYMMQCVSCDGEGTWAHWCINDVMCHVMVGVI